MIIIGVIAVVLLMTTMMGLEIYHSGRNAKRVLDTASNMEGPRDL